MERPLDVATKRLWEANYLGCASQVLNGTQAEKGAAETVSKINFLINLHLDRNHVKLEAG